MTNVGAYRDLAVMGGIVYLIYKLKSPVADAKAALGDALERTQQIFNYYSTGGELKTVYDEQQEGKTDTEIPEDFSATWTNWMRDYLGSHAPDVPEPPTAANPLTGTGMQETVQILPIPPAQDTPELTPEIERMIFAPAPDRPDIQIFPDMSIAPKFPIPQLLKHDKVTLGGVEYERRSGFWMSRQPGGYFQTHPNQRSIENIFQGSGQTPTPPPPTRGGGGGGSSPIPWSETGVITNIRHTPSPVRHPLRDALDNVDHSGFIYDVPIRWGSSV